MKKCNMYYEMTQSDRVVVNSKLIVQIIISGNYFRTTALKDAETTSIMICLVWRTTTGEKLVTEMKTQEHTSDVD